MAYSIYCLRFLLTLLSLVSVHAWTTTTHTVPTRTMTTRSTTELSASRRQVLQVATTAASLSILVSQPQLASAASKTDALLEELQAAKTKLQDIPDLLEAQKWDDVRSILKTPPVAFLWNLGDSKNTVLQLAKETGNVELFELKDDLAYNLQMTDQLTYDNVFVYFQPGAGKINIKEPKESAMKAMRQLEQIIAESKN